MATVTQISASVTDYAVGTTVEVDPSTLLLIKNIRDAQPDKGLIDSVRALGVLEIITVLLTPEGCLQVKYGHRRTLAAIKAARPTVRVYIEGTTADENDEAAAKTAEVNRLVSQRDENTHRVGLTTAEDLGVVEQLALIGLSAAQITKQARIKRQTVDSALTVLGSEHTKANLDQYQNLTIDQMAGLAEFEDDPDAYASLLRTATNWPHQFAHTLQRARDDREDTRLKTEARAALEAEGINVLDKSPGYENGIENLRDAETNLPLTVEDHAACPGRACLLHVSKVLTDPVGRIWEEHEIEERHEDLYRAALEAARQKATTDGTDPDEVDEDEVWESIDVDSALGLTETRKALPHWYCLAPAKNGHRSTYSASSTTKTPAAEMSEEERDAAKKARALVIANNKAWDSAETVRRAWLAEFAKRKTAPKGTGEFLAAAIRSDLHHLYDYQPTPAADWLGTTVDKALDGASENRALHIALVQVLARYEHKIDKAAWRQDGTRSQWGRYLRFLQACGYDLSDVEQYAISKKTA